MEPEVIKYLWFFVVHLLLYTPYLYFVEIKKQMRYVTICLNYNNKYTGTMVQKGEVMNHYFETGKQTCRENGGRVWTSGERRSDPYL